MYFHVPNKRKKFIATPRAWGIAEEDKDLHGCHGKRKWPGAARVTCPENSSLLLLGVEQTAAFVF